MYVQKPYLLTIVSLNAKYSRLSFYYGVGTIIDKNYVTLNAVSCVQSE